MAIRKGLLCLLVLLAPAAASGADDPPDRGCVGPSCHVLPSSPDTHSPAGAGECAACHRAGEHYSADRHSLESFDRRFAERDSCLGCHDRLRQLAESSHLLHAPFRDGPCTSCHAAHRSSYPALLREPYPHSVYSSFDRNAYALCWECHESSLATEKFSTLATDFRLGSRNFHFSHLQKRKGMTCRACHLPHGSPQAVLVRDTAPAGLTGWRDTMSFGRDSAGGRCVGGCHKDISYRR